MKISKIIICAILFSIPSIEAQIVRNVGMSFGYVNAKQNWDYTPQSGITASDIGPISCFSAGVIVEVLNLSNFSGVIKLQYFGKGRTIKNVMTTIIDLTSPNGYIDVGYKDIEQRLDYISIPVLAKLRIETPIFIPYVAIGPRFEYLIAHASSVVYDKFKKTEWSSTIAVGSEISISTLPKFLLEVNYNKSITDSFENGSLTVSDNSIEILFGVLF